MTIEEAIETAIRLEKQVHSMYASAAAIGTDPMARRVFQLFAQEELGHVAFLEKRLAEWRMDGCLSLEALPSILPTVEHVNARVEKLQVEPAARFEPADLDALHHALRVEDEATRYYENLVQELPDEAQTLFERFLDMEVVHSRIVQAVIDLARSHGLWLDLEVSQ